MKAMKAKMTTAALLSLALAACGTKTNPVEGYDDLKNAGSPQPTVNKPQTELGQICSEAGPRGGTVMNFSEGNPGQYVIEARCLEGIQFELLAQGLPADASFARNPQNPEQYVLSWTPKKGTVPANSQRPLQIQVNFEYKITAYPKDQVDLKAISGKTSRDYTLSVTTRATSPVITAVKAASETITQGEKVLLTVEAQDPAAIDGAAPSMIVENDEAGASDVAIIPAKDFIKFEAPKALGGGKYVFTGTLDTASLQWSFKNQNEAMARALITFQTADGHSSSQMQVNVKVLKKSDATSQPEAPQKTKQKPAVTKKKGGKK